MNIVRSVFTNVSYLLIARMAFRVLTAVVLIYAARYLGVERFGMFETALAWSNAFLALNDVGMSTLIVREAARDEKKMAVYFGNTLAVEVVLSIVLYAAIIGIGLALRYDPTIISLMMILGAAGLVFEFRKVMRGIFRVVMDLKFVAILEVINGVLYLLLAIWIFSAFADIDMGMMGLAHSRLWVNVLVILAMLVYTLRFIRPTFAPKEIWPMIKQSYVFTLYNLFFMLYFQIDQIILSIMKDSAEVGIYSAPAKIVSLFLFIPLMVFQVIMPLMYRYSTNNIERYKKVNHLLWRYLAAFGIPAGIGLWFLAPNIIGLVFDASYSASVPVLAVMGLFLAIRFTGISQGNSLTTNDRQGLRAVIQIVSVGINIVLDILLITTYGALGAAYATLITEAIIASCYIVFSAHFLKESIIRNAASLIPVLLATAGMVGALFLFLDRFHVILLVLFGALVYVFLLWIFRFFKAVDRQIVQQIVQK